MKKEHVDSKAKRKYEANVKKAEEFLENLPSKVRKDFLVKVLEK